MAHGVVGLRMSMSFSRGERFEEYELKLEVSADQMARVRADPLLKTLLTCPPVTRKLRSIYFDTTDHMLRASGISLRVRQIGKKWIQTVKAGNAIALGVWRRTESETRVDEPEPCVKAVKQGDLRKLIERAVRNAPLRPVFETLVRRTTHQLLASDGGQVELALDRGEVRAPHRRADICEVELELKRGDPRAVFEIAELLFASEPIRFSNASKSEFGYRTATEELQTLPEPMSAARIHVSETDTVHTAFHSLVLQCSDLISRNMQVIAVSDHPEGPHQLRVALRKLRCVIRAYQPMGENSSLKKLDTDARNLSRLVGELRDADVLIADIVEPVAQQVPNDPGLRTLGKVLRRHREKVRRRVRDGLDASWVSVFQLRLLALAEAGQGPGDAPKGENDMLAQTLNAHASSVVDASWTRVVTNARRLNSLSVAERHETRKALRDLRYITHFHAPLFPKKPFGRFIARLKLLQNVFGYLNDVALAEKLSEICAKDRDAAVQSAIGRTISWHETQADSAWLEAKSRLRAFKKVSPFWRV